MATRKTFFMHVLQDNDTHVLACINRGTDINIKDPVLGFNACHIAVAKNCLSSLKVLLKLGIKVNQQIYQDVPRSRKIFEWYGPKGSTPLHIAAQFGYTDCIELLYMYGSDDSICDETGKTPIDWAKGKIITLMNNCTKKVIKKMNKQNSVAHQEPNNYDIAISHRLKILEFTMEQMDSLATNMVAMQTYTNTNAKNTNTQNINNLNNQPKSENHGNYDNSNNNNDTCTKNNIIEKGDCNSATEQDSENSDSNNTMSNSQLQEMFMKDYCQLLAVRGKLMSQVLIDTDKVLSKCGR